jgi:hypothetical protein
LLLHFCFTLIIYQKLNKTATKYEQFADIAAPHIESDVYFISIAERTTLTAAEIQLVTVPYSGCPSDVNIAEVVCINESVTALPHIMRTSFIKSSLCS